MQNTPRANRLHIAIFGRRNAGKSSLINALTHQDIALVSNTPGTTTDPVYKAMEILPIGPVVLIDTAGIDDEGELGKLRVQRTKEVLFKTDLALMVVDPQTGVGHFERKLIEKIRERRLPIVGVVNKIDQGFPEGNAQKVFASMDIPYVNISAIAKQGMEELKKLIIDHAPRDFWEPKLIGDLLQPKDTVVLVTPIDASAPKGRLILPQVMTLRDILDHDGIGIVTKETELKETLAGLKAQPKLVVTDSQVFSEVSQMTPFNVPLTSFSILFARYKGDLESLVAGAKAVKQLKPGDRVLVAEACTHHRQEEDIGTVKIPDWLEKKVGGKLNFEFSSGMGYPPHLNQFNLVVHCGGCMITRKEMLYRIETAEQGEVPIVNYGVVIAYLKGILPRVLEPFPSAMKIWKE